MRLDLPKTKAEHLLTNSRGLKPSESSVRGQQEQPSHCLPLGMTLRGSPPLGTREEEQEVEGKFWGVGHGVQGRL